jgi:hypothetical protein
MKLVSNTLLAFKAESLASLVALAHELGLSMTDVITALTGGPPGMRPSWDAWPTTIIPNSSRRSSH